MRLVRHWRNRRLIKRLDEDAIKAAGTLDQRYNLAKKKFKPATTVNELVQQGWLTKAEALTLAKRQSWYPLWIAAGDRWK